MSEERLRAGAENLLRNCSGLNPGDHLLILQEDADNGYYDADLAAVMGLRHYPVCIAATRLWQ